MKRFQARRGSGRFTRNTLENTFGFSAPICAECNGFNTVDRGQPMPTTCRQCGKPFRERDDSRATSGQVRR